MSLFGLDAGAHHLTNLALHVLNTLLVLAFLARASGAFWPSALVACLFGLHPLHVESVAWISERKDLLCAGFGLASLWAWVGHARRGGVARYVLSFVLFALGLLCKPMLVTLPAVLLLVDHWPLGRMSSRARVRRCLIEKAPFVLLAAGSCAVTLYAHRSAGTLPTLEHFPWDVRVANALWSYLAYLGKLFWPIELAVYYPHARSVSPVRLGLALGSLSAISLVVFRARWSAPWAAVGWLWYLGMLVPVIGIVQVGAQGLADRYTYLPSLGVFMAGAWTLEHLVKRRLLPRWGVVALASLVCGACGLLTRAQVGTWADTMTLFRHAAAVTRDNDLAWVVIGNQHSQRNQLDEAERAFERAIGIRPGNATAWMNLGLVQRRQGRSQLALRNLERAVEVDPRYASAQYNLANQLRDLGRIDRAIVSYRRALERDPGFLDAHTNLAVLLLEREPETALGHFREVARLDPRFANGRYNLGHVLLMLGHPDQAREHLEAAAAMGHPLALERLAQLRAGRQAAVPPH